MKKVNIEDFKKLYNQGLNDTEISKRLNVTHSCITYIRYKLKLSKNFKYKTTVSEEEYLKYYNQGLSDKEICKILKVGKQQVYYVRNKLNIGRNLHKRFNFNNVQMQVIVGGLLGDSSLRNQYGTPILVFSHSLKQEEYAKYKSKLLGKDFMIGEFYSEYLDERTNNTYKKLNLYSVATPSLNKLYELFYVNKVKRVLRETLDMLDPLGLAIWYMDDGYINANGACSLSTNCFTEEEKDLTIDYFKSKYSITCTKHSSGILYMTVKSSVIFINLIKNFIHPTLYYKVFTVLDKQGELLENPTFERQKEDNQQPSLSSNTLEGSTTNSQILSEVNSEDSNADTSALHSN